MTVLHVYNQSQTFPIVHIIRIPCHITNVNIVIVTLRVIG